MIYNSTSNQYQWYCNKFVILPRFSLVFVHLIWDGRRIWWIFSEFYCSCHHWMLLTTLDLWSNIDTSHHVVFSSLEVENYYTLKSYRAIWRVEKKVIKWQESFSLSSCESILAGRGSKEIYFTGAWNTRLARLWFQLCDKFNLFH